MVCVDTMLQGWRFASSGLNAFEEGNHSRRLLCLLRCMISRETQLPKDERIRMIDRELLKKCESDTAECLLKAGHQEELLKKLQETGGYDSFVLLEAISKVSELREQLSGIQSQLKELSNRAGIK